MATAAATLKSIVDAPRGENISIFSLSTQSLPLLLTSVRGHYGKEPGKLLIRRTPETFSTNGLGDFGVY